MEALLGLGRSQRNLNKQQLKDLKLQDKHQQQLIQLQQQKQQTQAIITNQNYYTTQQQPQNQRHVAVRGQTTNTGALKPDVQKQQQQFNEEERQQQHQNVQTTPCTTPPKWRNSTAATTTTANVQQLSLSTPNDNTGGVGSAVQQLSQPQTIEFQNDTVTAEVASALPSTIDPTNLPGIVANSNVKTFRKINRQQQHQRLEQQQHKYNHLLHQQQQLKADLDAIEVCVDPEPHVSFKSVGALLRQTKSSGLLNHQHHHSTEDPHGQCIEISSLQLLQLQQQQQHDYSYAYYEPGVVMKHTNIPDAVHIAGATEEECFIPPPPNSIRALLLKGKKNKLLVSPTTRESYQVKLTQKQCHSVADAMASSNCNNISIPENFYEEISASSTSSSGSNSMVSNHQKRELVHSANSLTQTLVEEERRRVQNRHHKILGQLNLSVEAMLMPESPSNSSSSGKEPPTPAVSVTTASGQPSRLTSSSADNICDMALVGGPADAIISPTPNAATASAGILQSSCLAAELDSISSGASCIGSLHQHKTKAFLSSRTNSLKTTITAVADGNVAAKNQKSGLTYTTQNCRSCQRGDSDNINGNATATSVTATLSSAVEPASATTSSCSIKHLPQIHHNAKEQQQHPQQQLLQHQLQHQSHLHHQHHHNHLHQQHKQSQKVNNGLHNSTSFFTRASCGCRILNCAKIRAVEDPGPVVLNAQAKESKARSFWTRKGCSKLPGFSISTSSINDPG